MLAVIIKIGYKPINLYNKIRLDRIIDGWMNEQMDGWMDERADGWMKEQMDEWKSRWMNETPDGWLDKWADGWINGWLATGGLCKEWINKYPLHISHVKLFR